MRIRKAMMFAVLVAAVAADAAPTNVGVAARKLIVVDRALASGRATTTFVAKDPAIVKGEGDDPTSIEATLALAYEGITGNAAGRFEVPRGAYHGTAGWLPTHGSSVKFVNPAAPGGSTVTRLAVVRPGSLLQLRAEGLGDLPFDIVAAGTPAGAVATAFCVTNGTETSCHCSEFPLGRCVHRVTADGAGAKLVCRDGIANPDCAMMVANKTLAVSFTTPGGVCGEARVGGASGTVLRALACGAASTGGGASSIPEGPLPSGFTNLLTARCHGGTCELGSTTAAQTASVRDCTDIGCNAGPWMPTANGGLSTCIQRVFLSEAGGSLDLATGEATITTTLQTAVTVTGNGSSPCPRCVAGICGPDASNPGTVCAAVNAAGATYECLPNGVALQPYQSGLESLTTATVSASGPTFCPDQNSWQPGGCFGHPSCDYIEERGVAAGPLDAGPMPATLAAVFCTRATGNGLIDGAADFPGPNAVAMPAIFELRDWLD